MGLWIEAPNRKDIKWPLIKENKFNKIPSSNSDVRNAIQDYQPSRTSEHQTIEYDLQMQLQKPSLGHHRKLLAGLEHVKGPATLNKIAMTLRRSSEFLMYYKSKSPTWAFSALWSHSKQVQSREPEMKYSLRGHNDKETTLKKW